MRLPVHCSTRPPDDLDGPGVSLDTASPVLALDAGSAQATPTHAGSDHAAPVQSGMVDTGNFFGDVYPFMPDNASGVQSTNHTVALADGSVRKTP